MYWKPQPPENAYCYCHDEVPLINESDIPSSPTEFEELTSSDAPIEEDTTDNDTYELKTPPYLYCLDCNKNITEAIPPPDIPPTILISEPTPPPLNSPDYTPESPIEYDGDDEWVYDSLR